MQTITYPKGASLELFDAVRWGDVDLVLQSLRSGAQLGLLDERGESPLHRAILAISSDSPQQRAHRLRIICELIRHGARIDLPDALGRTPLDLVEIMLRDCRIDLEKHKDSWVNPDNQAHIIELLTHIESAMLHKQALLQNS